jgi:hypothetical protein
MEAFHYPTHRSSANRVVVAIQHDERPIHCAPRLPNAQEATMAKNHGSSVKNDRKYEALRDKGYSKERSAKIANSGKKSSRKGGKHSH